MKIDIIKAWKDEEYRSTLTDEQLAQTNNPAGSIELSDIEMQNVNGGTWSVGDIPPVYSVNAIPPGAIASIECCYHIQ